MVREEEVLEVRLRVSLRAESRDVTICNLETKLSAHSQKVFFFVAAKFIFVSSEPKQISVSNLPE